MAIPNNVIDSGLPIPGVYKNRQQQAETAYQQALIALQQQERSTSQNYGFTGDTDPNTGAQSNIHIDPTQQYSQVLDLLRGHAGNMTNLRNQLTGAHLGKMGLSAKRSNLLRFMQQGQVAGLGTQYSKAMSDIFGQRGAAKRGRDTEFNSAESDAVAYAIANGLFNAAPDPGAGGGGGGGGAGGGGASNYTGGSQASTNLASTLGQAAVARGISSGSDMLGGPTQGRYNPDEIGMGPGSLYVQNLLAQSAALNPNAVGGPGYYGIQMPTPPPTRRNRAYTEGY